MKIATRYYRPIPMDRSGYETEILNLNPKKTALLAMHCWNIGCEDGPPIDNNFYVGMGFPEATIEAGKIMKECIRPVLDGARKAGILVCHIESDIIARKHPEAQIDADPAEPFCDPVPHAVGGWRKKMEERFHGVSFLEKSPIARMDRAALISPLPGEAYVYQTGQLDRLLRKRGIENLIYTGFCTDMCVLRASGGIEPMTMLGYRIFLMRDATLGAESPDTFEERLATRWAVRYFETHFGSTLVSRDFIIACTK